MRSTVPLASSPISNERFVLHLCVLLSTCYGYDFKERKKLRDRNITIFVYWAAIAWLVKEF